MWDLEFAKERHRLVHNREVKCIAVSANGRVIATGSFDSNVRIWSHQKAKLRRTLRKTHEKRVYCCALSADGTILVSGDMRGVVAVTDLSAKEELGGTSSRLLAHTSSVSGCDVSADGSSVFSVGLDRLVAIWGTSGARGEKLGDAEEDHLGQVVEPAGAEQRLRYPDRRLA